MNNEFSKVLDTILSIPGMNETVKIDFKISRRNALLLSNVIERGLEVKEGGKPNGLLESIPAESLKELAEIAEDCLEKAGLKDLSEKLKAFNK